MRNRYDIQLNRMRQKNKLIMDTSKFKIKKSPIDL